MADKQRQVLFNPTLLPEEQEAIKFLNSLTALEKTILESRTMPSIKLVAQYRSIPFSVVAKHALRAMTAWKRLRTFFDNE